MSTVLQALQELEGKIAPADATAWTAEDLRWRWGTAGGVAAEGGCDFGEAVPMTVPRQPR